MSFVSFLEKYFLETRTSKKALCKKAGITVDTLRRFMNGGDVGLLSFKKIVQAVDYEIHLHPKKK